MAAIYKPGVGLKLVNVIMRATLGLGLGPPGVQLLSVRGRRSGTTYTTPVSAVHREGSTYLVSPYGNLAWARNARVAGEVTLGRGSRRLAYSVSEITADEAGPVLRQYVRENKITAKYFDVTDVSTDAAWVVEAPRHPVFRLEAK
jgi:deazaflavin-dependent oxidoreductase (nitroreductase family)